MLLFLKNVSDLKTINGNQKASVNSIISDKCCNKLPDILGGVVFVSAGVILLLNNFNVISWSIWSYLLFFWPVIFIFIGLDIISRNSWPSKIITTIIGLFIIIFILTYSLTAVNTGFRNYIYKNVPVLIKIFQKIPGMEQKTQYFQYNGRNGNLFWGNSNSLRN